MKLSQLASALNARLDNGSIDSEIINTEITGLNGIEQAGPGEITFVNAFLKVCRAITLC